MTTMLVTDALQFDLLPEGSTGVCFYRNVLSHIDVVTRLAFSDATPCTIVVWGDAAHDPVANAHATATVVTADPEVLAAAQQAPILRAVEDLRVWLSVTYEQLARMFGWQSASVLHYWRARARENQPVRPRATAAEPILRLHALLKSLTDTISGDDPSAVRLWTRTPLEEAGGLAPIDLLQEGRLDEVERFASRLLFDNAPAPSPAWRRVLVAEDDPDLPAQAAPATYDTEDFG
jgi:hypothetical protein